ncbi:MAG: PAC2 family protein [Candidatus Omnitrophica bacterium]|nr:PAC2 family protein [Candidatus Omnitrophota bacterium]MBU1869381.1 PAC2 family protein [Candidatus Omnitrophota bacterium]
MMEGIKITKKPRLRNPYLIVAWPGMGEVAFKAATFLVEKLKAEEFAAIPSEEFFYFTGSVITKGIIGIPELPQGKFYFWKNPATKGVPRADVHDLIIFISNAQPDLARAEEYSKRIVELAKDFKVKTVVGFASMPQAIDHTQDAAVWFTATSQAVIDNFKKFNFHLLTDGQISGMNGLFLGVAKAHGFEGFCLLGEIPLYTIQIENPRASAAVLEAFAKILNIQFGVSDLLEQAHTMEAEINKLLEYLKVGPQGSQPITEEDIEKIKKSLTQLTKLPVSIKDRIEKLFQEAKANLGRANELKVELDRWNVYKEYEDRFLDLFRKAKGKGN